MKIGIDTGTICNKVPDEREAIRRYADIGFDALDYGYCAHVGEDSVFLKEDWEEYADSLARTARECGILFSQAHAPMYSWRNTPEDIRRLDELTRRAFRVCEIIGAPYLVIHPRMKPDCINGENAQRDLMANVQWYRTLLPLAKKHHVKIALENMFGWDPLVSRNCRTTFSTCEEMLECIRLLDSEDVVVCLDTGHSHLVRQPLAQEARLLGKHLKLLHVHDNCGFNDEHLAPGYGSIPWPEFLSALRDIGYDGVFSAETFRMGTAVPAEASVQAIKLVYAILDSLLRENGLR